MNKEIIKGSAKILVAFLAASTGWTLLKEGKKNFSQANKEPNKE